MPALIGSCRSRVCGWFSFVVLIAGGLAACGSDTTRFRDSPFFNPSTGSVASSASARAGIRPGAPILVCTNQGTGASHDKRMAHDTLVAPAKPVTMGVADAQ